MTVERAIPRFPGPKFYWHFWASIQSLGLNQIAPGPLATTPFDYYVTEIDVYAQASSTQTESFQVGFQPTIQPITGLQTFFGGQISPNTGLYFPWRGLLQWLVSEDLDMLNANGEWTIYVSGFLTSSNASQS